MIYQPLFPPQQHQQPYNQQTLKRPTTSHHHPHTEPTHNDPSRLLLTSSSSTNCTLNFLSHPQLKPPGYAAQEQPTALHGWATSIRITFAYSPQTSLTTFANASCYLQSTFLILLLSCVAPAIPQSRSKKETLTSIF
jgi:hypothetical protein